MFLSDCVPESTLPVHLAAADVHLVSLDPSWEGCMLPSKFQVSFTAGRPVLLVGSKRSSLGRWMVASGGGWLVEPGDLKGLHRAVEEALDPKERQQRGASAQAFALEHFDREHNCSRIAKAIAGVLQVVV